MRELLFHGPTSGLYDRHLRHTAISVLAIKRSVGHVGGTTGLAPPSDILAAMLFFIGA